MREIPIKCFAVSAVLIRDNDGTAQVLLLRRTGTRLGGAWCQVAGAIEHGETAWQAALREIREETGLLPDRFYSGDYCEQFYEADKECISLVAVFVGFVESEQEVVLNQEHSEYRWVTFDEADALLPFGGQRAMLKHVFEEFVRREPSTWLLIDTTQ